MTNGLWRAQLALVWAFGLAVFFFLFGLLGGAHGGNSNSVYDMVYEPLGEGQSVRGSLAHPFAWFTVLAMAVAWLAPLFAALLAWRGWRALKGEGEQGLRDRIRAGTVAAFVIVVSWAIQQLLTAVTCAYSPARGHRVLSTTAQNRGALRCEAGRHTASDLGRCRTAGRHGYRSALFSAVGCSSLPFSASVPYQQRPRPTAAVAA